MRLLPMLLLGACASYEFMDGWSGRHIDDAIVTYGPANRIQELSNGDQVMIWTRTVTFDYHPYSCRVMFVAESNGRIRRWSWEGQQAACNRLLKRPPS
jgi:hypothetical protein